MTLHQFQRNLAPFNIWDEVVESIEDTSDAIVEYNQAQLYAGKRSTGTDIKPEYAEYTVLLKDAKGQPSDRVTLKDTGSFYSKMFVDVNSETFEIDSQDLKTLALMAKYGNTILGLTKVNKGQYVDYTLFPALKQRIETKLNVKLT